MAKRITRQETIQDNVFENAIESARQFLKVMKDLRKELRESVKDSQKALEGVTFSRTSDLKKLRSEKEKLMSQQAQMEKINQEEAKTQVELAKLERERIKNAQLIEREQQKRIRAAERETKKQKDLNNAYTRASRRLTELRKRYKNLAIQNKENTKEGQRLLMNITALDGKLRAIDATVGQNQRNVGNYSSAFKGLRGGIVATAGALGLAGGAIQGVTQALKASFRLFSDFGLVTSKVRAITTGTAQEISNLEEQSKLLGSTTPFTASQVAQLQLELSKLGQTASQISDSTEAILNFAIATDSELGQAAKTVGGTLNAFNLEASEAARVADVAAKAFNQSSLDIEKFDTAMSVVGATANEFGLSIEETTAALGVLVNNNVDASSAATGFRKILAIAAKQGRDYKDVLSEITQSTNGLKTASEIFGLTAQSQASILANNIDNIEDFTKELEQAEKAAEEAAKIIGNNLAGDVKRFQSAMEGAVLEGEGLNTFFRFIVQLGTRLISVFRDISRPFSELFDSFGELGRSLGLFKERGDAAAATAETIGKIIKVIQIPITLTTRAIKALVDLTKELVDEGKDLEIWDTIGDIFESVGGFFEETGQKVDDFIDRFPVLREVVDTVSDALDTVGDFLSDLGKEITDFLGITDEASDVSEDLEEIEEANLSMAESIQAARTQAGLFSGAMNGVSGAINKANTNNNKFIASIAELSKKAGDASQSVTDISNVFKVLNRDVGLSNVKQIREQISVLNELITLQTDRGDIVAIQKRIDELTIEEKKLRDGAQKTNDGFKTRKQLIDDLAAAQNKLKEATSIEDLKQQPALIAKLNSEIDRLQKLLGIDELAAFREENKRIQDQLTKDTLRQQQIRNGAINSTIKEEILTAEQKAELIASFEEGFQDEVTELQIKALRERIANGKKFGQNTAKLQLQLNDLLLKQTKDANQEEIDEQKKKEDQILKNEEAAAKKQRELNKKRAQDIRDNANIIQAIGIKVTERQLKNIDARIQASQREQDTLKALAAQGNASAVESLQRERKREAERLRQRERIAARQRRIEAIIAGVKVYASKVESGSKNPVGETVRDAQLLIAGLSQLYEGTEFVDGNSATKILPGGKDAYASRLHYGERVVDDRNNVKIGSLSNDDLADVADKYNSGLLVPLHSQPSMFPVAASVADTSGMNTKEIVGELKSLKREVKNGNARTVDYNAMEKMMEEKVRQGNKWIENKYKLKKFLR